MNTLMKIAAPAEPVAAHEVEFNRGDKTTCQFGNPSDSDWEVATHANVAVEIIEKMSCEITGRMYYLVKKIGQDYVGRAAVARGSEIKGALYCTNARSYKVGHWTGIETIHQAARSLGFGEEYSRVSAAGRMIAFTQSL